MLVDVELVSGLSARSEQVLGWGKGGRVTSLDLPANRRIRRGREGTQYTHPNTSGHNEIDCFAPRPFPRRSTLPKKEWYD